MPKYIRNYLEIQKLHPPSQDTNTKSPKRAHAPPHRVHKYHCFHKPTIYSDLSLLLQKDITEHS